MNDANCFALPNFLSSPPLLKDKTYFGNELASSSYSLSWSILSDVIKLLFADSSELGSSHFFLEIWWIWSLKIKCVITILKQNKNMVELDCSKPIHFRILWYKKKSSDNNGTQKDNKQTEVGINYQCFSLSFYSILQPRVALKSLFSHANSCLDLIKSIPRWTWQLSVATVQGHPAVGFAVAPRVPAFGCNHMNSPQLEAVSRCSLCPFPPPRFRWAQQVF